METKKPRQHCTVADVYQHIIQRTPRNEVEERERELVNALWRHIDSDPAAAHIAASLIGHYNTVIFRLQDIIEGLGRKMAP